VQVLTIGFDLVDGADGEHNVTVYQTLANNPIEPTPSRYLYRPKDLPINRNKLHSLVDCTVSGDIKLPIYPSLRIGDVVRVVGRINEWKRKDGRVVREIDAGQGNGGEIGELF
jgi:hypothetical protein